MKLIVTSDKIKVNEDKIMVACVHCGEMHELEVRKMDRKLLRNQPWCSACRAEAARKSKKVN